MIMKLVVPFTLFISLIINQFANAQGNCTNNTITQCASCGLTTVSPNLNNICTSCQTGFYLSYYSKCFSCAVGCAVCQNQSSLTCSACLDGYYLINTQCLSCSQSTPLTISGLSYSGITGCAICNAPTSDVIPTCSQCGSGYLISGNSCTACPSGCAICSSNIICTTCSVGFTLLANGLCSSCLYLGQSISGCGVCDSSNTKCLACQGGQTLASSTVTTCTNFTNTQANNCFIQGSSQKCAVCIGGYYLTKGICSLCPTGCICTSSNYCTSCSFGYLLIGSVCISCSNTTSTPISNVNYTGEAGCNICQKSVGITNNIVTCTQCQDGYFIVNVSCASCGTITKQLINKAFYYGVANCAICSLQYGNNATCTACNPGYFLNGQICDSCSNNCAICDNSITCSVCFSQEYLASNGSCMNGVSIVSNCYISNTTWMCLQCSPGYFYKTSQCMTCLPNCLQCNNNSYCITCATNYSTSLFNGSCIPTVVTTFYNMNPILFNDKSFGLMIILIIYFLVNH